MARVTLVALRFWPATGGVESITWEVSRRLRSKHEITVVASDLSRENPLQRFAPEELVPPDGISIVRLPGRKRLPLEGYGVHLEGLSSELEKRSATTDVFDVHAYGSAHADSAVSAAGRGRKPSVLHAYFHPASTAGHPLLRKFYDSTRGVGTVRQASRLVALTGSEQETLSRQFHVPIERIAVIPAGIDTKKYFDAKKVRERGRMLCVGRLANVKGFDIAVRALAAVRRTQPNARLSFAGQDWGEKAPLQALARALHVDGHVEFLGPIDDDRLVELYQTSDVLLMPSRYESFGITALEAVACGCPAIVANVGGLPDAAGPGGVAVERSSEAFAKAATDLISDRSARELLARSGRAHAQRHDWDAIAAKHDALWREVSP